MDFIRGWEYIDACVHSFMGRKYFLGWCLLKVLRNFQSNWECFQCAVNKNVMLFTNVHILLYNFSSRLVSIFNIKLEDKTYLTFGRS